MANLKNKYSIFGVHYFATDYNEASTILVEQAKQKVSYTFSALAVHGLIEAYKNPVFLKTVNSIDMVVPDGQPIRWVLNSLYNLGLKDRVCGPDLTLHVLKKADKEYLKVYLYGSTAQTLQKLTKFINTNYPNLTVCGAHVDRFREATDEEDAEDILKINSSGAHLVLVGRGCPRQEKWVEAHKGKIDAVMIAIGAAFDFHAQVLQRAPVWMQKNGMEWLYRLCQEPRRLWKRNLVTNSMFIYLFFKTKFSFLLKTNR
jgi:N-acetylglucosaminyldiphosphoundecaprenol N-acetyl-beta-D-mannosaminyltransferase